MYNIFKEFLLSINPDSPPKKFKARRTFIQKYEINNININYSNKDYQKISNLLNTINSNYNIKNYYLGKYKKVKIIINPLNQHYL